MIKLLNIQYRGDYQFDLSFSDGAAGVFDLRSYLEHRHGPLLVDLQMEDYAVRAFIDAGAMCWPNGLELSASRLHELSALKLAA